MGRAARVLDWLISIIGFILGFFPCRLPTTGQEFDKLVERVLRIYKIPDNSSYRHAIATMIMQLGQESDRAQLRFFGRCVRKAQANQVAYAKIMEIREQEKAEEIAKQAEATAQPSAGGSVEPISRAKEITQALVSEA